MNKGFDASNISTLDIKRYIFFILSNWYLFVISLTIAVVIAYIKNRYVIPQYAVYSNIMLTSESKQAENIMGGLSLFPSQRDLQNEIGVLTSYSLNQQAVNELNFKIFYFQVGRFIDFELYNTSPFTIKLDSTQYNTEEVPIYIQVKSQKEYKITKIGENEASKKGIIGETFNYDDNKYNLHFKLSLNSFFTEDNINKTFYFVIKNQNALTSSYISRITILPLRQSTSILNLSVTGPVPQKDADYLNKIIEVYIRNGLEEKNKIATNIIAFINQQLGILVDSLTIAQDNLQNFRLDNRIFNVSTEGTELFKKLDAALTEKNLLNFKKRYYLYILKDIQSGKDIKSLMPPSIIGIDDNMLFSYMKDLVNLYSEKEILQYSLKKDIPAMDVLKMKIDKSKEALIQNINHNLEAINIAIDEANTQLDRLTAEIQKLPYNERKMINMTRDYDLNDKLYTYLLQKRSEAEITKVSNKPDFKVLDVALAENAIVKTSNQAKYTTSLILGFIIPLLLIFIKDFFNTTIRDRSDIEGKVDLPIMGSVGHYDRVTGIPIYENPKSVLSESFRSLRTNLQYLLVEKKSKVIAVTSTISGEGKTFCAINLAAIIALSNKKTLLMGLDMRKPKIHKTFNIDNEKGISSYLIEKNSLDEIIMPTFIENLYLASSGPIPPNPAELIETERMAQLVSILKEKFEYIIVDTPPIALVTDALLISKFTDANIFVIRQNYSFKNVLKLLSELKSNQNLTNLSILINDVKVFKTYGYKYGYKYGYRYGYGYGYNYSNKDYYEDERPKIGFIEKIKKIFTKNSA